MSQVIRRQVLASYRQLLRTCQKVFSGDIAALSQARVKVREAYLNNKHLTSDEDISAQIQIANETSHFLREGIIQAQLDDTNNVYKLNITKDTKLHDNVPLKEVNIIDLSNYKVPDKYS